MRVLLVDDQSVVRDTLRSILRPYSEVDIVGEATDGEEAVVKVAQLVLDALAVIHDENRDGELATNLMGC